MAHKQGSSWTERTGNGDVPEVADIEQQLQKQAYHRPHNSVGATHAGRGIASRLIHMTGVFVPLIAGELVQDATKYKKVVRIASIGTAAAYELLDLVNDQIRRKEQAEKLAECRGRE